MMYKYLFYLILLASLLPISSAATEPDFFILFQSCKTTVGYLVLSDSSIKTFEGEPTRMVCFKQGDKISCTFTFNEDQKGINANLQNYNVLFDSPPLLHFATENHSEFIAIDTNQHAAVLINRIVDKQFAGSKICHGLYATSFEMKNLQK